MMYYFLQSGIMLLAAYFLGCWAGCALRNTFGERAPVTRRTEATYAPSPAGQIASAGLPVATPAAPAIAISPRPAAATEPVFRRADTIQATEPPPAVRPPSVVQPPAPAATAAVVAAPVAVVAPASAPVSMPAPATMPAPVQAPAQMQVSAPQVPATQAAAQAAAKLTPSAAVVTGVSVTAAAAAAAAAAIAQGRARDQAAAAQVAQATAQVAAAAPLVAKVTTAPAPTPAAPVPAALPEIRPAPAALIPTPTPAPVAPVVSAPATPITYPAAGASSGMSGVAVGGQLQPSAVSVPSLSASDDLKRIRGVGPEIETALNRVGVRRYAEIAGWSASDVDKVSKTLGLKGRIEHENWIEQAQVLSKGGETAFSRRYDRGEIETVTAPRPQPLAAPVVGRDVMPTLPASVPVPRPSIAPAAVSAPQVQAATPAAQAPPIAASPAPAAASSGTLAAATRATTAETSSQAAVTAAAVAAAAAAAQRARLATAPAAVPQTATVQAAVAAVAATGAAAVANIVGQAPAPRAAVQAVPATAGDDLTRIRGIDGDLARMLGERGVTKFAQIGTWTGADADRFGSALSLKLGRVQQESWIEQARLLAGMGPMPAVATPAAATETIDRAGGTAGGWHQREPRSDWAPNGQAPIGTQPPAGAAATSTAAASVVPAAASVGGATPVTAPAGTGAATIVAPASPANPSTGGVRLVRSGVPDDLKRIKGIGVVLEKKLHGLGVINYGQIAGWSQADIDKMSTVLDFKGRIERENWIEQARILASGGITDFARRVDRGEVETSKPRPVR